MTILMTQAEASCAYSKTSLNSGCTNLGGNSGYSERNPLVFKYHLHEFDVNHKLIFPCSLKQVPLTWLFSKLNVILCK